jgi:hypothetical protein
MEQPMTEAEKRKIDAACDDEALRESPEDRRGDRDGDPQRGGRLPAADAGAGDDEPRPADDAARGGIPSRSFNL